jgi:fibronectin type 3 domain-containing protein
VNSASTSGSGFTLVGGSFPVTLNPNQSTTLQVQFKPTAAGSATGSLTISSNSANNGTVVVSLSGTGTSAAHEVDLSWSAPDSSPDPVAGYNIYRSTGSGASQLINPSMQTPTSYVDNTVVSGSSYNYIVKSVDSSGAESVPSNQVTVTIP